MGTELVERIYKNDTELEQEGSLKVWHIPQIPGKPFEVFVDNIDQAIFLINALADYDLFQFENNIKPDYANMSGLSVWEDGEWLEWDDPETGDDIDVIRRRK